MDPVRMDPDEGRRGMGHALSEQGGGHGLATLRRGGSCGGRGRGAGAGAGARDGFEPRGAGRRSFEGKRAGHLAQTSRIAGCRD
eukprot:10800472-Alexandrium_andersonii.AAC.1